MKNPLPSLLVVLGVWAIAATTAGAFRLFERVPPLAVQFIVAGLSVGFSVAVLKVNVLRTAAAALSTRTILGFHLMRFVGAYFLWLAAQGRLPHEFAARAGWGDIIAAAGALALLFSPRALQKGPVLLAWNVFGAIDLIVAVGTASWLNTTRPGSMVELAGLPLALVPLFFVPVLMASHIHLIRRIPRACGNCGPAHAHA